MKAEILQGFAWESSPRVSRAGLALDTGARAVASPAWQRVWVGPQIEKRGDPAPEGREGDPGTGAASDAIFLHLVEAH